MCNSVMEVILPQKCCGKFSLRAGIYFLVTVRSLIYLITIIVTLKPFYQSVEEPLILPASDQDLISDDTFFYHDVESGMEDREVFALVMGIFFTCCLLMELLLVVGIWFTVQCLIALWLCYACVVGVFFLGLVIQSYPDFDLICLHLCLLFPHVYCCLIVLAASKEAKSNPGEVIGPLSPPYHSPEAGLRPPMPPAERGMPIMIPESAPPYEEEQYKSGFA